MTKSLKSYMIDSYAKLIQVEELEVDNTNLILLTSLGAIQGTHLNADESNKENTLLKKVNDIAENEYFIDNSDIQGNDEYVALEDVLLITPNGDKVKFPHLNVFYDQVIGVTVGNLNANINTDQV